MDKYSVDVSVRFEGASGDLHHTMLWYFFRFNDHDYINLSTFKYRTASKVHVRTSPKYKKNLKISHKHQHCQST